jgi:hypothetical protein
MRNDWLGFWSKILAGFALGFSLATFLYGVNGPDCPTEDSCTVDYRNGEWQIEEVRP